VRATLLHSVLLDAATDRYRAIDSTDLLKFNIGPATSAFSVTSRNVQ
jgi:hypothetical protein